MPRFLHTADWQLGMKAVQAGVHAPAVRQARFAALHKMAQVAKEENVDFIIAAGDIFEAHDVDDLVVKKCVDALSRFAPIPVYVLPGNHDPLVPGGVWQRSSWRQVGIHVKLLETQEEIDVGHGTVLLPFPLKQKHSRTDPTATLSSRQDGDRRVRIGVAHGGLDTLPEKEVNFPIAASRASQAGLDYMALGDWHGTFHYGACHYSGTHEQTKFGESDPGNVLIVDVPTAGREATIKSVRVGSLRWTEHKVLVSELSDVKQLEGTVRAQGPLGAQLLRVRVDFLAGVQTEALEALHVLRAQFAEEAMHVDWPEVESPPPLGVGNLPAGVMTDTNTVFETILDGRIPEGEGRELAGDDKAVITQARQILHYLGGKHP